MKEKSDNKEPAAEHWSSPWSGAGHPFAIGTINNEIMGCLDIVFTIGNFKTKDDADRYMEELADHLSTWPPMEFIKDAVATVTAKGKA